MTQPLLELRGLRVHFQVYSGIIRRRRIGTVRAVDGVSLDIAPGETVASWANRVAASQRLRAP